MNYYPDYPGRKTLSLDGFWDFYLAEGVDWNSTQAENDRFNNLMSVPGAFDCSPEYYCKRGTAFYRRFFHLEESCSNAVLKSSGLGLRGRFLIDGREIGRTELAYSGVEFQTDALSAGNHELVAIIDNQFESGNSQLFYPYYDFYAFGGLYRSIELQILPALYWIERVQVRTLDYREGKVSLNFKFGGQVPETMTVGLRFDTESGARKISLAVTDAIAEFETIVPDFKLWSPKSPALHTLTVKTGEDSIVEQFGIREITTKENTLRLNGEVLYLKGFNRHESHPQSGPASPESLMIEDLQNLKKLNCNFVRGCHYPQDQRFLELCDRAGMLVWEESLGWGNIEAQMADPVFMQRQEEQTRLMVRNSINHPSIIIWGFMNEFHSETGAGRELCSRLINAVKEEDDSRIVTFACNHTSDDICYDLVDIISFNTYPGWIDVNEQDEPTDTIKPQLEQIITYFRERLDGNDKPIIISEMGTCAVYGQHDLAAAQWTEEFQAEYLTEVIRSALSFDDICGVTIWQMNDAKSYLRKGANIRCKPFAQNLAGVFDQYRRPKLAATVVKNMFNRV
jgi:beta-glucuronidase